jgi:hypothetical protein
MNDDGKLPLRNMDDEALLYDWFKHLTSLSLLTLGGVLSLSQVADAQDIKKPILTGVLIALAAAGVLSFSAADQMVRARANGSPLPKQVLILQKAASALLSMGVGAFLYIFVKATN